MMPTITYPSSSVSANSSGANRTTPTQSSQLISEKYPSLITARSAPCRSSLRRQRGDAASLPTGRCRRCNVDDGLRVNNVSTIRSRQQTCCHISHRIVRASEKAHPNNHRGTDFSPSSVRVIEGPVLAGPPPTERRSNRMDIDDAATESTTSDSDDTTLSDTPNTADTPEAPDELTLARELVLRAHPDVIHELVSGTSLAELLASIPAAEAAFARVVAATQSAASREAATARCPAVAPSAQPASTSTDSGHWPRSGPDSASPTLAATTTSALTRRSNPNGNDQDRSGQAHQRCPVARGDRDDRQGQQHPAAPAVRDVPGTAITYNRENAAPTVAWYDVGDTWAEARRPSPR